MTRLMLVDDVQRAERKREEHEAMVDRRSRMMVEAYDEGVKLGGGPHWPKLGPLNFAEKKAVREWVATSVRWMCERETLVKRVEEVLRAWGRATNGEEP